MFALEVDNLSYAYPDLTPALQNVSLRVKKGRKTAILGTNGSGKTTLIYHLNGLIAAREGSVRVMGEEVSGSSMDRVRRIVGLLFDSPDNQLFSTTVFADVAFGPRNLKLPEEEVSLKVRGALQTQGIESLALRPPYCLSLGQKKRAAMAGILAMEPQVLVCDEPFSGLDPAAGQQMRDLLDEMVAGGRTLVYSTHDVDLAYAWADCVAIMKRGTVLEAGDFDLLRNELLMREACLQRPVLARLFAGSGHNPRTVEEAAGLLGSFSGSVENALTAASAGERGKLRTKNATHEGV